MSNNNPYMRLTFDELRKKLNDYEKRGFGCDHAILRNGNDPNNYVLLPPESTNSRINMSDLRNFDPKNHRPPSFEEYNSIMVEARNFFQCLEAFNSKDPDNESKLETRKSHSPRKP